MDVEMTSTRVSIRLAKASQGTRATKKCRVRGLERNLELDPSRRVFTRLGFGGPARAGQTDPTGQATKGTRWMPRHQEAMKDVETCEKLRGAGLERRSVDLRIGKPGGRHGPSSCTEYIGV